MSCTDPRECEDCGKHLYEYQHHELDAAAAQRIRSHLQDCPSCMTMWQEEEAIRNRLRQCACEPAPDQLRVQVSALIATFRRTIG